MTARMGNERVARNARQQTRDLDRFDYAAGAELFLSRNRARSTPQYRRFDTAAEAVRFVVESLSNGVRPGAYLLVEEVRFDAEEIRYLYDSAGYPLPRVKTARPTNA